MFSIVVPCYNCEKSLEKCYKSIAEQKESAYEIILVDDGSTDDTFAICDKLSAADTKTTVLHQKNGGLMNAWKNGVRQAAGDYIVFVDSDDWVEKDLLLQLKDVVDRYSPDVITYGFCTEYEDGSTVHKVYPFKNSIYERKADIERNILPFFFTSGKMESQKVIYSRWSKAIKREILLSVLDQLDESISIGEDTLTSFLVFLKAQSVYNLKDSILYHYVRTENSMMGNYGVELVKKLVNTRNCLIKSGNEAGYLYIESIENYLLDNVLITIKKVLWKKTLCWKEKSDIIDRIMKIDEVQSCMKRSRLYAKEYDWKHKLFIEFVKWGRIS